MIPLVDLKAQYASIKHEIDAAIERVLGHTGFVLGREVEEFERAFASYCGTPHGIGVASGTAALHLALRACGIGEGDEVITSPFTFIATAEAIWQAGARPVFVDIDPRTYNLDPALVPAAIGPRTKAIVAVHLYGNPAPMQPLADIARLHGLRLIEDAAQAHGARYGGCRTGALGDAGCFSFYPGKNLGGYGDGGMVVTGDSTIAERVRLLRDHGRQDKYTHQVMGFGERLDALQAAILGAKLAHLDEWNDRRREAAAAYRGLLSDAGVTLPTEPVDGDSVYHLFVVRVAHRDEVLQRLRSRRIGAGVHYPVSLHLQPACTQLGYSAGAFPHAEMAAQEVLSLPIYPEIGQNQLDEVVTALVASLVG